MSAPQTPITIADLIVEHVAHHGSLDVETGLFLIGSRANRHVSTVAFAGSRGVDRSPQRFALSGRAVSQLFCHLREGDLVALALVHSHRGPAGLSRADLDHGFSVEGFTSAVIPYYRRPPHDSSRWGWWQHEQGRWRPSAPLPLEGPAATVSAVVFDEDGVREA
jgi:hypothetical protein